MDLKSITFDNSILNFLFILVNNSSRGPLPIDPSIVNDLNKMIDEENPIAKNFRMAADRFKTSYEKDVKLCLIGRRSRDGRMYNLPTCTEVAALIVGM